MNRQTVRHEVDVIGEIFPRSRDAWHVGLSAQFAFGSHFARHCRDLIGENRQRFRHRVDGVGQRGDFAFGFHNQFLFQIAVGNRCHDARDAANLRRQVARHEVDVIGEVFPRSRDVGHARLSAQFAFGSHFARHGCDLFGEDR